MRDSFLQGKGRSSTATVSSTRIASSLGNISLQVGTTPSSPRVSIARSYKLWMARRWSIGSQPNGACALLQWTILSQPDGVCVLAHESFARDAATLIAQSSDTCPIVAVQDVTYKVFGRDWGLYRCAIASKHFDEEGIPKTSSHTFSLGVNEERAVLQFTGKWHARGNRRLGDPSDPHLGPR